MQAQDGAMVELQEKQFNNLLKHGNSNLARVGDVFKIRQCFFELETISEYGISAKGISRRDYLKRKKQQRL